MRSGFGACSLAGAALLSLELGAADESLDDGVAVEDDGADCVL
ncbi:MAG TPA: hypothetical protein VJO99_24520 [Burkholderiaceae bacterium]|nr:hypothetical protein [Burkholderiaceae bacterium]